MVVKSVHAPRCPRRFPAGRRDDFRQGYLKEYRGQAVEQNGGFLLADFYRADMLKIPRPAAFRAAVHTGHKYDLPFVLLRAHPF
jgi:hypothetical protein